uniref:Integrase catalytic domain-containing protein n=1 Tax=Fagus sylvatica TaxID=28930 RepID=A0A2N9HPP7_FAGSY
MAPGSRGVGAVFVHFSGEDSGQTGDAFGEPRVPRRSRSHYLSNAPGLADQLVASRKDSAREGGCPGGKNAFCSQRVFLQILSQFARIFDLAPDVRILTFLVPSESLRCLLFARPCTEASLGSQDMILRTGGRRNVPYAKGIGQGVVSSIPAFWSGQQVRSNLGQTWSTLVEFGQNSPNSGKCIPDRVSKGFWARWTLVGLGTARSNLGQTSVNPGQTWSTLVKLGQPWSNLGKCVPDLLLREYLMTSQASSDHGRLGSGSPRFACRHPRKSRGLVEGDDVRPLRIETRDIPAYCVCIEECMNVEAEIDNKPCGEILYKRTHDATLLRCVDAEEANRLIQEMHAGLMGAHANGPFLARKIMRAGYYWLTMERDCIRHVQTCHKCQMYQNSKNAPPQYLHTMASPWPFSAWGMDVIGAITPKASNGHEFILVAIDYFTKWVEACSFKNVTQVAVTRFVKNNIICRYGMPEMLITDNASNLNNRMMDQLCQQFKIQHHNSAPYRPKMNGAVEAANKNVKKILSKMTETYKDWHEHLPYALCAYRTSVRTSVGATPYSLVYGMEAVLPVEVEIPSLRILSQTQLEEAEWAQARYEQLNFIDEKRLAALCHGQLYQRRIERAYNKKARPRTFQPGDLVLKKRNMALSDPRGKFAPSYEGPYVVKKAFSGGAIILADMDGEEFRSPINSDSVIKYHV